MGKVYFKVRETKKISNWVYTFVPCFMFLVLGIGFYTHFFLEPADLPINPIYWNDILALMFIAPMIATIVYYYLDGLFYVRKSDISFIDFSTQSGKLYLGSSHGISFNFKDIEYVFPSTWGYTFKIKNRLFKISKVSMMLTGFLQQLEIHNIHTKGFDSRDYVKYKTNNSLLGLEDLIEEEIKREINKNQPR